MNILKAKIPVTLKTGNTNETELLNPIIYITIIDQSPPGSLIAQDNHIEWGNLEYVRSDFWKESLTMRTSRGLLVRSKSELLIVEMLYRYGIPFRYEQELWINGKDWAPDFTFEGADGRPFIPLSIRIVSISLHSFRYRSESVSLDSSRWYAVFLLSLLLQ